MISSTRMIASVVFSTALASAAFDPFDYGDWGSDESNSDELWGGAAKPPKTKPAKSKKQWCWLKDNEWLPFQSKYQDFLSKDPKMKDLEPLEYTTTTFTKREYQYDTIGYICNMPYFRKQRFKSTKICWEGNKFRGSTYSLSEQLPGFDTDIKCDSEWFLVPKREGAVFKNLTYVMNELKRSCQKIKRIAFKVPGRAKGKDLPKHTQTSSRNMERLSQAHTSLEKFNKMINKVRKKDDEQYEYDFNYFFEFYDEALKAWIKIEPRTAEEQNGIDEFVTDPSMKEFEFTDIGTERGDFKLNRTETGFTFTKKYLGQLTHHRVHAQINDIDDNYELLVIDL